MKFCFTLFGRDLSNGKSLQATIRSLASAEFKYSPARQCTRPLYREKKRIDVFEIHTILHTVR